MLRAGLVDEVSLLVAPLVNDAQGRRRSSTSTSTSAFAPRRPALAHVERRANDVLWLRYRVADVP